MMLQITSGGDYLWDTDWLIAMWDTAGYNFVFQVLLGAVACKRLVHMSISAHTTLSAFQRRYALPLFTILAEGYPFYHLYHKNSYWVLI